MKTNIEPEIHKGKLIDSSALCRWTLAKSASGDYIVIITNPNKTAKLPKNFERVGKSYLANRDCEKSHITNYPYGERLLNGSYAWDYYGLPKWTKVFEKLPSMSTNLDYKERFEALLKEMLEDRNGGLISLMIAEGIAKVCPDHAKWVIYHVSQKLP